MSVNPEKRGAANRGYRREVGIEGVDLTEAVRVRNQFDQDEDGKLAPDEWRAAKRPLEAKQFDEDGDGLLSIEEISTRIAPPTRCSRAST